jgi:tape measure domain-containing protein
MSTNVGSIDYSLKLDTKQFDMAIAGVKAKMTSLGSHANGTDQKVSQASNGMGSSLMGVAGKAAMVATAVAGVGLVAGAMVGGFIKMGSEAQDLRTNLDVLTGSTDNGAKMYKKLVDFAAKTPFETTELVQATQQMLSFGISTEQVMPYLKSLGDVAMGDKNKLAGLTYAFSQVQSTGRLMGQDLMQMINQGFNPLEVISKKTGESMAQLKERMEAGGISAQEVADALTTATSAGGRFYGGMDKASQTLSGRMSTLKDNAKTAIRAVIGIDEMGNVKEGGIFDKVSKGMEKLFPVFDYLAKNAGPAVEKVMNGLGVVMEKLSPLFTVLSSAIKPAIEQFKIFWEQNKNWLIPVLQILAGAVILNLIAMLTAMIAPVILVVWAFNQIRGVVVAVISWFAQLWASIVNIANVIWQNMVGIYNSVVTNFDNIKKKIEESMDAAKQKVSDTWDNIKQKFEDAKNYITNKVDETKNYITNKWNEIYNNLVNIVNSIINFFSGAWNWLYNAGRNVVQGLINGISNMAGNLWNGIAGVSSNIGRFFAGADRWLWNAGAAIMNGLLGGIKDSWNKTASFLSSLGGKIKNLKGPLDKDKVLLVNEGNAIMQGLNKGIQGGYGAVEKTLSGITSNIPKTVGAEIAVSGGAQQASNTTTISMGDIHIADKQTADYFFGQLNRNGELARKGLATL